MRRPDRVAVPAALVGLLLGVTALSGCLALPRTGPVVAAGTSNTEIEPGPMYIDPLPPHPGDSQAQIVKGFLDAMLATPVQTNVAREFLSREARASWDPQQETITFDGASPPRGTSEVTVDVTDAHLIDSRGAWKGDLGDQQFTFGVVQEDGQYRIDSPPDALIVQEQWYEQRFRQVSLYFFDPTGTILVPEPVFVPEGEQLASTLVRGLLAGAPGAADGVSTSFFPARLTAGLSVPVSSAGIADIALAGDAAPMTPQQTELLLAQLTTTLRQDPAITGVRVTIDGQPLDLPGGAVRVQLDRGESYAPYAVRSSSLLYGLRGGVLVGGGPQDLSLVAGPFGTTVLGIRSISPDLVASSAAAISADGTSVLMGPVRDPGTVTQVLSGASDLLPPAWDVSGRLWLVDRTPDGARVLSRQDDVAREVSVPGVSGQDVRTVLVSRDGSRLVAVVRSNGSDSVVVSRILHDAMGRVIQAAPAVRIDDEEGARVKILDVAWRTPTSLAVLTRVNDALFQVRGLSVDGAPGGLGSLSTTIKGDIRSLAGSPAPNQPLYAVGPGVLVPLSGRVDGQIATDPSLGPLSYSG